MTRTVVITGSASGIGQATALLCAEKGWRVVGLDKIPAERYVDIRLDLANPAQRHRVANEVALLAGQSIDAVIACAGVVGDDSPAVNYFGMRDTLARLRPLLAKGQSPRAVAITSSSVLLDVNPDLVAACLRDDESTAQQLARRDPAHAYSSSKYAMQQWLREQAGTHEWVGHGILLNGIAPGLVETPMTAPLLASGEGRAILKKMVPMSIGRNAQPEEMAQILMWLATPENSYLVGQVLHVDGGKELIMHRARAV